MRETRNFYIVVMMVVGTALFGGCAGPEALAMRPATSPEGWRGNAFYRNEVLAAEEFSSGTNGSAVDVWRFYDDYGRIYTEERDTNGGGKRNLYRSYNKNGELVLQKEDTTGDGIYDQVSDFKSRGQNRREETDAQLASASATPKESTSRPTRTSRQRNRQSSPFIAESSPAENSPTQTKETASYPVNSDYPAPTESTSTAIVPARPAEEASASDSLDSRRNWIRPVKLPAPSRADSTDATTRIVPGPIFHHPSDDLEE